MLTVTFHKKLLVSKTEQKKSGLAFAFLQFFLIFHLIEYSWILIAASTFNLWGHYILCSLCKIPLYPC